jgi:hypothetical protein
MHMDHNFWMNALPLIWEGALKETGKLAIDQSLKAIQPYTDGLKALFLNKSKSQAIADLETNPAVQTLMAQVTKLIEANPELKAALQEAIALQEKQQVGLDGVTAGDRFKADIDLKAQGDRGSQVGARRMNVGNDGSFTIKQTIN